MSVSYAYRYLLLGGVVVCIVLLVAVQGASRGQPDAAPASETEGTAVVINQGVDAYVGVPSAEQVREDAHGTLAALRDAGLRVATAADGRCIATTGLQSPPSADVCEDGCATAALVAALCATLSADQFASRERGYVQWEQMSKEQQAIALQLAHTCGLLAHDRDTPPGGAQLAVEVGPRWVTHVSARGENAYADCVRLFVETEPPTQAAIAAPPLSGSELWWAWPSSDATWGDDVVDLEPGVRSLEQLASELCAAGDIDIVVAPSARDIPLTVMASSMPLRKLMWAIEVATGLPARLAAGADPPIVRIGFGNHRADWYHQDYNVLLPIPEVGYWSLTDAPIGQAALPLLQGGPVDDSKEWIGWRFSALPLLYQKSIQMEWERTHSAMRGCDAPAFDPQRTFVLWTRAIKVSIALLDADGGGQAYEFALPALYE